MIAMEELLQGIEKPGRYLGGEWNEVKKNPEEVQAKVALIFPDLYEIGMSYLGQKILYSLLNAHPQILAERVFAPARDLEEKLRRQNIPLFSLENKIPLFEFDILGFSLLYELSYSNILTVLDLGRVPLISSDRGQESPLVIAGGPASFNPEPVAEIFDAFLIGDGEEALVEIIGKYIRWKKEKIWRADILKELAKIQGVYVPFLYRTYRAPDSYLLAVRPEGDTPAKIAKRVLFEFSRSHFPEKIIVPHIQVVFDRVALEAARGCPQRCRFCQATSIYAPYRVKNPDFLVEKVLQSLRFTGYEDVSLSSLSMADYPYLNEVIEALMGELEKERISISLSSLRPQGLTSEVAKNILRVRKTGLTIVPEAGTERLRRVINKNLGNEDIFQAVENAFSLGWRLLKLYFMVGLPTETEEDLEGIISLVEKIIQIGRGILKFPPRINLSVSSFIPKPHTPFQWLGMEEEKSLQEKQVYLQRRLRKYRSVEMKPHSLKSSILEAIFSRGDRKLGPVLLEAWKEGARFDSWKGRLDFSLWERVFAAAKIDYQEYLKPIATEAALPWDHIDTGIKKSYLLEELEKAFRQQSTSSCLDTICSRCQGCDFWTRMPKRFAPAEKIEIRPESILPLGQKTEEVHRYRAFYAKLHPARFLSHLDLTNLIQRTLRRAGVSVLFSRGFHPMMEISYLPALPLGMEGKEEAFEFKSNYIFNQEEFVSRLNQNLPPGIFFVALRKLKKDIPPLNKDILVFVYSVDMKNERAKKASEFMAKGKKKIIEEFLEEKKEAIENILYDEKEDKLFLYLRHSLEKTWRPQEIVKELFGIENPLSLITREKVIYRSDK